jgi:hypothetical protein
MRRFLVVLLAAIITACGSAAPPLPSAEPSIAGPSPAMTPSSSAEASDTPEETVEPAPTPGPEAISAGDLVETAADRLQLRDEASLAAPSQGALRLGTPAIVVEGPLEADGYPWYRIGFVGLPWGSGCATGPDDDGLISGCWDVGWVAGADPDGSAWLVPSLRACPDVPTSVAELAAMSVGISATCFDGQELVLAAYLSPETEGRGCYPGYDHVPEWLGPCPIGFLQGTATEFEAQGPEIAANMHPDLGACDFGGRSPETCPMVPYIGQWITVTGHFSDPAAEDCTILPWEGNDAAPDEALGRHSCRLRFVITAVEPGAAP